MCWSAEADLVAGLVLGSLGLTSLGLVRHWRHVLMGSLPLLLAGHQLVEMRVWQTLQNGTAHNGWTDLWGFVAMPFLAVISPIAVMIGFPQHWRRLLVPLAFGLTDGAFGTYAIVTHGVTAVENHHVLDYSVPIPFLVPLLLIYQVASWGSWLVTGNRYVRDIGLAIGLVGGLAAIIDVEAYYSIWCSFGAVVTCLTIRWLRHADPIGAPATIRLPDAAQAPTVTLPTGASTESVAG